MWCLGMDIGGANIKVADGAGYASSVAFPLWKGPDRLVHQLQGCIVQAPECHALAVTMTGELADCFSSKTEGVAFILDAVAQAAGARRILVYQTSGRFVSPPEAAAQTLITAASNWHALAMFAGRFASQPQGLLLDIGSTTCDFVLLKSGRAETEGTNDTDRLLSGELVYTGVERTPVCAVVQSVEYRGKTCPVAAELFATMRDVYLVTGELPEQPECCDTADGRPATRGAAVVRLGRMICADDLQFCEQDALVMAHCIAHAQTELAALALQRVVARMSPTLPTAILSGHGEFLGQRLLKRLGREMKITSLAKQLGAATARCAAAHAVAVLAKEQWAA